MKAALEKEEEGKRIWWEKYDLLLSHEDAIYTKDVYIEQLEAHLHAVTSPAAISPKPVSSPTDCRVDKTMLVPLWQGKPPPIDPFSGNSGTSGC